MTRLLPLLLFLPFATSASPVAPLALDSASHAAIASPENSFNLMLSHDGALLLTQERSSDLLHDCSARSAPLAKLPIWTPIEAQAAELEAKLRPYMARRAAVGLPMPPSTLVYNRRYIGFMRDGVKYIYGDFSPAGATWPPAVGHKSAKGCERGKAYWGIIYRIDTRTFEEPEFNDYE